jgi:MORN repeat variant
MEMETKPEPEPETVPKICPNCSEKNNPEFDECWKCQHSFLPWSEQVRFWAEGVPRKLISLGQHIAKGLGLLFFVGLCLFCWGLISNVIFGEMTTGQYLQTVGTKFRQSKQTIKQTVRNEWRGPILETLGRITSVGGNGPVRKYFGNGCLKSEMPYKNGEREGMAKSYYENGRVRAEGLYKNGKLVGKVKEYSENGFLKTDKAGEEVFEQTDVEKPAREVRAKTESLWGKLENITKSEKAR